jgi:hypothetical protein
MPLSVARERKRVRKRREDKHYRARESAQRSLRRHKSRRARSGECAVSEEGTGVDVRPITFTRRHL